MNKILNYLKNKINIKNDMINEEENDILFKIDQKIKELEKLKEQVIKYLNNSKEDANWINYQNILFKSFENIFKKIIINNFWFKDKEFTADFFKILHLIQENNFFIIIDSNPIIIIEKDQKEIVLFKISMIYDHIYSILNKLVYINVSNNHEYAKNIIMVNLLFFIEKIENKNDNLKEIIEKYAHSSSINNLLIRLNSNISLTSKNEGNIFEVCISLVAIIESMRREVEKIKLSKKYYNQTDNRFALYFNKKKNYKNLKKSL